MRTIFKKSNPVLLARSYLVLAVLFLCLPLLLSGCGGGGSGSGGAAGSGVKVSITIPGQANGIVTKMAGISAVNSVTVDVLEGAHYVVQGQTLFYNSSNGTWGGIINNLPMNTALTFVAHAYDSNGKQIFSGSFSSSGITITHNGGNSITITVSPVTVTANFPIINGVTMPEPLSPSQSGVDISVAVSGSSNDVLTYNVNDTSGGAFSNGTSGSFALNGAGSGGLNLIYNAPSTAGTYTESITVTNSQGNSVSQNFTITVNGTTNSIVTVQFAPAVTSVTGYRSGSDVYLTATVSSPGNDPVSYQWSFGGTGGVAFSNATANPATMTPYSQTVTGTISLAVTDTKTSESSTITFPLPAGQFPDNPVTYQKTVYMGGSVQGTALGLTNTTDTVSTFAGTAGTQGFADGTGTAARFYYPEGITTDGTNLYVANTFDETICKIGIANAVVTTLAGNGGIGSADGTGTGARFYDPFGITTDGTNLYVADTYNDTIRQIVIATGQVTTLAGTAGASGPADGTGTTARFYDPSGITTDGTNLYVADTGNYTVRQVVIATGQVTTLAGSAGVLGQDDGTGTAARFNRPFGITTDGTNLYVADTDNETIRQIVIKTGVVTTLAGSHLVGFADGTGTAASFHYPNGITTDGTNLYVADANNDAVRQIVIATGQVTTLAGSALTRGSADGTGTAASFYLPEGITTDGTDLYVADTYNDTIRKIK